MKSLPIRSLAASASFGREKSTCSVERMWQVHWDIREIGVTDSELFQHFDGQFGKIDLSVSFPCQRVLIVPRFVPQYLFAEAIKGTGNSYIVRMRFHVFTSLRVRKGG